MREDPGSSYNAAMSKVWAALAGLLLVLAAHPSAATVRIETRARQLGYGTGDCSYCHTFDLNHMKGKVAEQAGVASTNCQACHAKGLPKTGAALFNDRGKWLRLQKARRKAVVVDPVWLRDYQEAKKPAGTKR